MGESVPLSIVLTAKAKVSMHAPPCRADQDLFLSGQYSKTCVKRPLKNRQNKGLMTNGSLMKVESIAEGF